MRGAEELMNAPWPELIRRARESALSSSSATSACSGAIGCPRRRSVDIRSGASRGFSDTPWKRVPPIWRRPEPGRP
jgi:hypothetical protein